MSLAGGGIRDGLVRFCLCLSVIGAAAVAPFKLLLQSKFWQF